MAAVASTNSLDAEALQRRLSVLEESIVPSLQQLLSQLYSRQQSMMHVQQVMHVVLPVSAWTQTLHEHKRCMNKGAEESMDISGFQEVSSRARSQP